MRTFFPRADALHFHRDLRIHIQPVSVVQELFNTHCGNLAVQQIADIGLVLSQESGKLFLRVAAADIVEQGAQDACFDLQHRCVLFREAQVLEDVVLGHVTWLVCFCAHEFITFIYKQRPRTCLGNSYT
jgi:hypothetical protein